MPGRNLIDLSVARMVANAFYPFAFSGFVGGGGCCTLQGEGESSSLHS